MTRKQRSCRHCRRNTGLRAGAARAARLMTGPLRRAYNRGCDRSQPKWTQEPEATPMPTPNELYDQASDLRDQGDKAGAVAKLEEAVAQDPSFAIGHGMLA